MTLLHWFILILSWPDLCKFKFDCCHKTNNNKRTSYRPCWANFPKVITTTHKCIRGQICRWVSLSSSIIAYKVSINSFTFLISSFDKRSFTSFDYWTETVSGREGRRDSNGGDAKLSFGFCVTAFTECLYSVCFITK